jgi:hypothetical protein
MIPLGHKGPTTIVSQLHEEMPNLIRTILSGNINPLPTYRQEFEKTDGNQILFLFPSLRQNLRFNWREVNQRAGDVQHEAWSENFCKALLGSARKMNGSFGIHKALTRIGKWIYK